MNNVQSGPAQTLVLLDKGYAAKIGGGTIADASEMHLLDAGAIAFFDQDNNLIAALDDAAALAGVTKFYIAQGMPVAAQGPRKSVLIDRNTLRFTLDEYEAPVAQVSKFGEIAAVGTDAFPGTPLNGTIASCIITDTSSGQIRPNRQVRVEVKVYSTDTAAVLGARLRDAINASAAAEICTVTYTNATDNSYFTFTGVDGNTTFEVGFDDVYTNITRHPVDTVGQKGAFAGVGTNAQVVRMLAEHNLSEGDAFRLDQRNSAFGAGWWNVSDPVTAASGLTFDIVTIQWNTEARASIALNHIASPIVYLAEEVGGAGNAATNTLLGILRAKADAVAVPDESALVAAGFDYA